MITGTKSRLYPRPTKTNQNGKTLKKITITNINQIDVAFKQNLQNTADDVKKNINESNYSDFEPYLEKCINILKLVYDRPVKKKSKGVAVQSQSPM